MARGLSSAVKTQLATGIIDPVVLVEIGFGTPIYLTNASFDITSSISGTSRTYVSNGHLRSITGVNETNRPTKNTLSNKLSLEARLKRLLAFEPLPAIIKIKFSGNSKRDLIIISIL